MKRAYVFEATALAVHLALVLWIRAVAWPEVTSPGYLWSRGLVLYRDVKFLHAPGLIGLLAIAFRVFGPQTWVVRVVALAGPLVAHGFVLAHTRRLALVMRALVSAFYVVALLASDGNAVWPTVLMSALAIPIASNLSRGRYVRAGLEIGVAILLKQTAAAVLVVVVLTLLLRKTYRAVVPLAAAACLPYAAALGAMATVGAAREMLFWTAVVPFRVQELTPPWGFSSVALLASIFVPTAAAAVLESRRGVERTPSALWLLAVACGFALLCLPTFMLMQTVAALPCLAVGAARLLEEAPARASRLAALGLAVWTASRGTSVAAGAQFDGKVLFWNDDPVVNRLVDRLGDYPPGAPVHSELWGNVLARAQRVPPGGIWVHPWLRWYFPIENIRERVLRAASEPGTIRVDYWKEESDGERVGPFAIRVVGSSAPPPPARRRETRPPSS